MAKNRLTYRAYTAAALKARASVPDAADITVNASSIDCLNITTMKIRNAVTSGVNTVSGNATSGNVNVWSAFGPTKRTLTAGLPLGRSLLTNSAPTSNFAMGDFAGYNHSADTPAFTVKGVDETVSIVSGASHVFYCIANIGEILYSDITYGATVTHVAFSVWEDTTYIDSRVKAISGMTNLADFSTSGTDRITVTGITSSTTYTCKIEMLSSVAYDYTGANTVCQVPGLDDWEVSVQIQSANHFFLNGPENDSTEYGSTFTSGKWDISTATFNTSTGGILINYVKLNTLLSGGYNHLHVKAWVELGYFDESSIWQGVAVTAEYDHLYDDSWNQNISQAFQVLAPIDIWDTADPIDTSGYGYRIVIDCDPSTI